jgi:hypothetical protein
VALVRLSCLIGQFPGEKYILTKFDKFNNKEIPKDHYYITLAHRGKKKILNYVEEHSKDGFTPL